MKKILPIAQIGSAVLRKKAKNINNIQSVNIMKTIEIMKYTVEKASGLGIAAPQISFSYQIILISSRPTKTYLNAETLPLTVMINPKILKYSVKKEYGWESCLSVPGYVGKVERSKSITVFYKNISGEKTIKTYSGLPARVIQHEIDHLNGVLYIDRINIRKNFITVDEYQKILKN